MTVMLFIEQAAQTMPEVYNILSILMCAVRDPHVEAILFLDIHILASTQIIFCRLLDYLSIKMVFTFCWLS